MNIIKIEDISELYPEPVEGTSEWYYCTDSKGRYCDLFDAEETVKSGEKFSGMTCHLVHYPEGTIYSPFKLQENRYIKEPVWDNGKLYFLSVDFNIEKIQIYSYLPNEEIIEMIKELPLGIVKDCYNLMLKVSPITLTREENECILEIVWPENKEIEVGATETFMFRYGDDLYLSEWDESIEYNENVIVRDLKTGKIKEKQPGYLCRLPDGVYWRI